MSTARGQIATAASRHAATADVAVLSPQTQSTALSMEANVWLSAAPQHRYFERKPEGGGYWYWHGASTPLGNVWLTDLLHHVASTAQLDGFDVDTSQAPPQEWLPANVKIRKWDIFTEVPDELVEQYDVVHVKMWVLVVKGDPTPILRNLRRMLKPGGWLQWGELDTASIRILKTTPSNPDDGLQQLLRLTLAQDSRIAPQWPSQLPGLFSEQGLAQVEAHRIDARPYQEFAMHECNLLIYDMIAQRGASGAEAKEISRLVPEAARESKEGVMFAFSRLTVVGQKPRD